MGAPPVAEPHDRCARCGRATPLGVSLCDADNPARIGAPSATQAHGTIFLAVVGGFVFLAFVARFALGAVGPFASSLDAAATRPDGGVDVVVRVTNQGRSESTATCRISRGGIPEPDDLVFMTEPIRAGETRSFARQVPPPAAGAGPYTIDRLAVACR